MTDKIDYIKVFSFHSASEEQAIVGPMNQTLKLINSMYDIHLLSAENSLWILKSEKETMDESVFIQVDSFLRIIDHLILDKTSIHERDIIHIHDLLAKAKYSLNLEQDIIHFYEDKQTILTTYDGKRIYPKTFTQKKYLDALENNVVIFGTGAAGSGKTFLAVAFAIDELKKNHIDKIIITRPAVEAGEKLGFLPGDLKEKVDPYLIPIYDAVHMFLDNDTCEKYFEKGIIEVAPLAYMRGRTLDHAVVILDEAQNTTSNQMKMFLTRLGFHSKMIITGDTTQIDLGNKASSGLCEALRILNNIPDIAMITFDTTDVMRHPVVSKIIKRYEGDKNDSI